MDIHMRRFDANRWRHDPRRRSGPRLTTLFDAYSKLENHSLLTPQNHVAKQSAGVKE